MKTREALPDITINASDDQITRRRKNYAAEQRRYRIRKQQERENMVAELERLRNESERQDYEIDRTRDINVRMGGNPDTDLKSAD